MLTAFHISVRYMPSLGMITINALAASDRVIIPVQAQYLPAKGMTQLVATIGKVKRNLNPSLKIDGIVLTLVDNRTNLARDISMTLRSQYGHIMKIYNTQVPVAVKAAEASAAGCSIYAYDKNSPVCKAYEMLTGGQICNFLCTMHIVLRLAIQYAIIRNKKEGAYYGNKKCKCNGSCAARD